MKLYSISAAARTAGCSTDTMRRYSNTGLVECTRLDDGTRIFDDAAVAKARELKNANIARLRRRAV